MIERMFDMTGDESLDPADLPVPYGAGALDSNRGADSLLDESVPPPDESVPPDELDESAWADEILDHLAVQTASSFEDCLAAAAFAELDAEGTLDRAAAARSVQRRAQADLLATAAHWADLHAVLPPSAAPGRRVAGSERLRQVGGDGTPSIAEFSVAELGVVLETTDHAAGALVADALDLIHRLPSLWSRVLDGQVEAWQARQVAVRTRPLSAAAAARVDARIGGIVGRLTGRRLSRLVGDAILAADPPKALSDAEAAAADARVSYRPDQAEHGYATMFIKAAAGDLDEFNKALDVVSRALKILGDTRGPNQRRASAVGILAHPETACDLVQQAEDSRRAQAEAAAARRTAAQGEQGEQDTAFHDGSVGPVGHAPVAFTKAVMYVHIHRDTVREILEGRPYAEAGIGRVENIGPVIAEQIKAWLGHANVSLKPVIDLDDVPPVDCYEAPARIREAIRLRHPADYFPYATTTSRRTDLDHVVPYLPIDKGGPPGQTHPTRMAPLTRKHHRTKTHAAGWTVTQIHPGAWLWCTPHGHAALVDNYGTHFLGKLRPGKAVGAAVP
jgi:hypothetical protein